MIEPRPGPAMLRESVIDEVSGHFVVHDVDPAGFVLGHEERLVRVEISADQLDACLTGIEDSAFDAMGIEPRWRSGLSPVASSSAAIRRCERCRDVFDGG